MYKFKSEALLINLKLSIYLVNLIFQQIIYASSESEFIQVIKNNKGTALPDAELYT